MDAADGRRLPAREALAAAGHGAARAAGQGGARARSTARTACSACCCSPSHDLERLLRVADVTAAMAVEALLGTDRAFAADLIALRPQPGQADSAANLRRLLAGSPIVACHRYGDDRVQDAYSLRCAPQVARRGARHRRPRPRASPRPSCARRSTTRWCCRTGASSRAATSTARRSPSPATSSPIAVAEVGGIAERRTDRLLDAKRSHGLPPFLPTTRASTRA